LENHLKTQNPSGTESQTERHIQNSNTDNLIKLEPPREQNRAPTSEPTIDKAKGASAPFPLSMTMDACPNLADYSRGPIANWRDFIATTAVVRPMLGVSLGAWEEARTVMGEISAAITVAAILQRGDAINNAGGYLRGLTEKARAGEFSVGPMLMALIGKRKREKKRA
jgi:replication initiation protein RepC